VSLMENLLSERITFGVEQEVEFEELYQVISPDAMEWQNGVAEFRGISVKTAGYQQRLLFSTDLDLPGGNTCLSNDIKVEIGPPHSLVVIEDPIMSPVYGGKAFIHQPLLHVVDKGNNIVDTDSSSRVAVFLFSNPTRTALQPMDMTVIRVENGIARFKNLFLAKAGEAYRFHYSLWSGDEIRDLEHSNITTLGEYEVLFDKYEAISQS
jgi:hypothetical protein